MARQVKKHAGIHTIEFSPLTRTLLIHFDPGEVRQEEIIIRVCLYLSLQNDHCPVIVLSQPRKRGMSDSALYAGASLFLAFLFHALRRDFKTRTGLDWLGGLATIYAVLDHAWSEVKREGNFHPEVLSLVYLLVAITRGNFFSAGVLTWVTSFGRHLFQTRAPAIELRPVKVNDGEASYQLRVSSVQEPLEAMNVFSLIPAILKYAVTGDASAVQGNLIDGMHRVSKDHDEVLEGLGDFRGGIPLSIQL
jgi:hypothetical protein